MTDAAALITYPDAPIHAARALPVQLPPHIFGRDQLLASGHRALQAGTAILIHGPTGSGKSTLAGVLAAAHTAVANGSVLWFTLAQDNLSTLLTRVARAYGNVTTADQPQSDQIRIAHDLLVQHHPLIVLDGAIDPAAVSVFVREAATGLPLIAIDSRLSPGPWTPIPLTPIADAARLSLLRAYGYQDADLELDSLTELATLIGGSPLALELAARHLGVKQRGSDDLILALYSTIDEVAEDDEAQAIDRMLSIVYPDLLPIAQGVCLVLGAVFSGSASAELLADLTQLTAEQLTRVMTMLSEAGLVQIGSRYGQPYYTMHEAIQADMRRRLRHSDRLASAEDRTVQALEMVVARHAQPNPADHDRLAVELPNVVAATAYAVSVSDVAPVRGLIHDLESTAGDFVTARGFQPELRQMRELLSLIDPSAAPPALPTAVSSPPPVLTTSAIAATTEPTVAAAAAQLPLPADSELKATEPIAPVEKPANPLPVITVTPAPASAHDAHSPQTGGRVYPVESAAPELPAPEPTAPPAPLHDQPAHMPEFDSYMDKRAVLTTAAPTTAEPVVADSKVTEPVAPIALDTASLTAQSDRNTPQGLQACIDSARAANDQAALADCALRLGDLYMNAQDMTDAITNYQIAIAALRTGSDQYLTALALERLGHAQLIDGEPGTAAQSLEAAVELLGSDTRLADRARVLTALGSTYDLLQDWSAAQRSHENGAEASQRVNDHAQEAIHLGGLARAHQAQGHPADAINSYRKGLHVAYRLNDSDLIAGYGTQLGGLLLTDGKTLNQAVSLLSESISRHPENVDTLRLLKRGQRWIDQARSNQVVLPDALDNPQYARLAYPAEIG